MFLSLALVSSLLPQVFSASVNFTWLAGNSSVEQLPMYPPALTPTPGSRALHCFSKSAAGPDMLYIHGGSYSTSKPILADLWAMSMDTFVWTMLFPSNTIVNYGVKGNASASVSPGASYQHSCAADSTGIFNFGGHASPFRNDLWFFNFTSSYWTWISGDINNLGGFSTGLNTYSPLNFPSARVFFSLNLYGTSKLVLFGGMGYLRNTQLGTGPLQDVWYYDIALKQWNWTNGSTTYFVSISTFGNKTNPSVPYPTGRSEHASVVYGDQLVIYGGINCGTCYSPYNALNDIWIHDLIKSTWQWVGGSNPPTNYDYMSVEFGQFNASNYAEGRDYHSMALIKDTPLIVVFGGAGYIGGNSRDECDVWLFNLVTYQWAFVAGDASNYITKSFGTKGVYSSSNYPPGRQYPSLITMSNSSVMLFGGISYYYSSSNVLTSIWRDDVWQFQVLFNASELFPPGISQTTTSKSSTFASTGSTLLSKTSSTSPSVDGNTITSNKTSSTVTLSVSTTTPNMASTTIFNGIASTMTPSVTPSIDVPSDASNAFVSMTFFMLVVTVLSIWIV